MNDTITVRSRLEALAKEQMTEFDANSALQMFDDFVRDGEEEDDAFAEVIAQFELKLED